MRIFNALIKGAAVVALSVVVACTGVRDGATGPTPIPNAVRVTAGGVPIVVAAPDGFCIDRATIVERSGGAFMFLSDCRVVASTGKAARVPISSILTVSISPSGLAGSDSGMKPALGALGQFLATPVGVFSLGKSNVKGTVSILQTKQTETALYLLVEDKAFSDNAGVSIRFWRAFTEVNGRLVALSVTGYTDFDPEERRSLRIIRAFMQAVIDANAATS